MKFIRIILFPLVPIYYVVTYLRNKLFDYGVFKSKSYDVPVICVGNLSTGGTGKTPMIEYLITLLKENKSVATLSRGYKRNTEGFLLAGENSTVESIGDEPYQFHNKFQDIKVAVDADRQNGIESLLKLNDPPEIVLLDDAFQHRRVKAGLNILLTSYEKPYYKDFVLPTGNLREPQVGRKRADLVIVTKCKPTLNEDEKATILDRLHLNDKQSAFFSYIDYSDVVLNSDNTLKLEALPKFTLVTGIANPKPLVDYLTNQRLIFDHIEYPDHHNFRPHEIDILLKKELILTTEKDFVRLKSIKGFEKNLFYLPIRFRLDDASKFEAIIKNYID